MFVRSFLFQLAVASTFYISLSTVVTRVLCATPRELLLSGSHPGDCVGAVRSLVSAPVSR